jgi:hypothetical protein
LLTFLNIVIGNLQSFGSQSGGAGHLARARKNTTVHDAIPAQFGEIALE